MSRRSVYVRSVVAMVAALLVLAAAAPALANSGPAPATPNPWVTVTYAGWTTRVPADWTVVDLAKHANACVRFDVHAVYLGHPGEDQECPTGLRGRTEALLVEPIATASSASPPDVELPGPAMNGELPAGSATSGEVRVSVPSAAVQVTGTWNTDPGTVRAIMAAGTATPGWTQTQGEQATSAPAMASSQIATRAVANKAVGATGFKGQGFDTCEAPSTKTMNAWLASPYRAVGVYIGGSNRACSQANLNASWVTLVSGSGWQIIPIYVGLQAPVNICRCAALAPSAAAAQGSAAADDAVAKARSLGMGTGSPIYFDMEGYDRGSTNTPGVTRFLSSWTARLHALGYLSGVYSGSYSGLADLVAAGSSAVQPDAVWYAVWDGRNATLGDDTLPDSLWTHARIHQYATGSDVWGGVRLSIDRNAVDTTLVGAVDQVPREQQPLPPPPVASVPPATVRDYIDRVFGAALGRRPTIDEANFWAWCLNGGTPTKAMVSGLLNSDDWARQQVIAQYFVLLKRVADPGGLQYWQAWMKAHRNPDVLAGTLAGADEYWFKSGWKPEVFVTNLYRDLLGRSADPGGLAFWSVGAKGVLPVASVAMNFATAHERAQAFVRGVYATVLRRSPDASGFDHWTSVYESTRDPASVVLPLVNSAEAINLR